MGAVVAFKPRKEPVKMQCSGCGAEAKAACDCGVPYIPVSIRAAKAIYEHPEKSNRVIARELKIGPASVDRARKLAVASREATGEKRIGKDGKRYKPTKPKPKMIVHEPIDLDTLEYNYDKLLTELTELVPRYRHMSDKQIRQALDHVLKQNPQ